MYLWWINFLVLAGNEHSGDSQQLQLIPLHLVVDDEGVDDELGEEECFVSEVEPQMHVYQPVQQNGPHLLVYLDLVTHEIPKYDLLFLTNELEYLLRILIHLLRVLLDFLRLHT